MTRYMQKESSLNENFNWSTSGMRVTLSYLLFPMTTPMYLPEMVSYDIAVIAKLMLWDTMFDKSRHKSVSHWIMLDYFFHVWKVNIFFFLIMFLIYSCSHVWSSMEKRSIIITYWSTFVYPPFSKWRRMTSHKVGQSSIKHMILS